LLEQPDPGLEINQDLDFQRREWRVQRVGRAVMVLLLFAALAGVFGAGPLSRATAGERETLAVEYDRFLRRGADNRLTVRVGPRAATGREVRLWVPPRYLERMHYERAVPEPQRTVFAPGRLWLIFPVASPGTPFEVVLDFKPQQVGPARAALGVAGGPTLSLSQFVYP
jgi:hypothetical protein